jgi:hypothetical protein
MDGAAISRIFTTNIASEGLGKSCKDEADRGRKSAEKLSLGMRKQLVSYEGDVDSGHGK